MHDVLARRECDVPIAAPAPFPDRKPDQFQPFEDAVGKMQLGIGEFACRLAFAVRDDLDQHDVFARQQASIRASSLPCLLTWPGPSVSR